MKASGVVLEMTDRPNNAYAPPLDDIWFALEEIVDLPALASLSSFEHAEPAMLAGVLSEAARTAQPAQRGRSCHDA